MPLLYYLYLLTFLGFPILGYALSKYVDNERGIKFLKHASLLFFIHNVLFFNGYSIKGDYPDYLIFSLEYFFICFTTALLYQTKNVHLEAIQIVGMVILAIVFFQGLIGILLFVVAVQDYETDKIYEINYHNTSYKIRRYCFGFVTFSDTKYTFDTYKNYSSLPFEKLVNSTVLWGYKSEVSPDDKGFAINIRDSVAQQQIQFSSSNGKTFTANIE